MGRTHLVIGASGFLGSHVARELVGRGEEVRVLVRPTSSTLGIDDLDLDRRTGDVHDADSIRRAMAGVDVVYHCVVDARAWLRDPAPLYRTNVEGLRTVLDVAAEHELHRFVHTSSLGTLPIGEQPVREDSGPHNWLDRGGHYIRSRVEAEELALSYASDRGVPVVAMCVANTYGARDHVPTPHGAFIKDVVLGRQSWYVRGAASEVVGVRDAARALVLAGDHGRPGERYIVSERFITMRALLDLAADAAGTPRPRWGIPIGPLRVAGLIGEAAGTVTGRDFRLTRTSVRLTHIMTPLDHGKATEELGWEPEPIETAIREAAEFFSAVRRV